ncbi:DUF2339 domain-containing protein [Flaviaesturariibacter flavus]|uniref:DUF2339 domain-containing protein n=1 Tax=Flaviaesturariibacter flavus TaxID=2502780 RepID=A0A4R1BMY6_9BACT|nr:DUF2339 domain-containing protein [Flaviaesturariibacter flavus]TCJ18765.1 DUF2339 domain-containing protein [Flaviaesturariibacter flavus]
MEFFALVVIIIFLIALLARGNSNTRNEELLHRLLEQTRRLTEEVHELRRGQQPAPPPVEKPRPVVPPPVAALPPQAPVRPPEPVTPAASEVPEPVAATPALSFRERFLRDHPDLEAFIGENLVNKIGIAILVLGIAFFVKYAIDQNWIGETGRVAIGFACGAALTGLAHYLRRSYRAFSSVLAGGGIAIFYTTISFAYHQYHLFSQAISFGLLVAITLFAVLLALLYDSLALAVIATVGGFATPLLVSNGAGNYVVLLSYLAVLNAGILALAFFRRWPALNAIALGATLLLVAGWLWNSLGSAGVNHGLALALITLLYALFLAANMAFPVRFGRPFRPFDLLLLLLITAAYYGAGMLLLQYVDGGRWAGLFTIGAGAVNLALALYCFRRPGTDRNLLYLLIGLTLTFATLAVPVQLEGHAITLFWSAEFVLLYWLFERSGIRLFKLGSYLLMALALGSLVIDWSLTGTTDGGLTVLFNTVAGAATNIVAIAAFAAYRALLRRQEVPGVALNARFRLLTWITGTIAWLLLYGTLLTAVNLYFYREADVALPNVYHRIVTAGLALATGLLLQKRDGRIAVAQLVLLAGALIYFFASQEAMTVLHRRISSGTVSPVHIVAQVAATALYVALLYRAARAAARHWALAPYRGPLAWSLAAAAVLYLSFDAAHYYALAGGESGRTAREAQYTRAALTILWGLCSFALMWLGMRHRARTLRLISLSLFTLALLKLFFYDLLHVSEGGKIAAFILLGALLLTVSFMYQKLKKILIDDRPA